MKKVNASDPFWSLYDHGNKILRERLVELDPKLAAKLRGVWLAAYEKILNIETGKRGQGIAHALEVDNNIGLILEHFKLLQIIKAVDLFILSATAVLHDLDKAMNESGRYEHGSGGSNQLQKLLVRLEFNLDQSMAEAISYLIKVHDNGDLNRIPENEFVIGSPPGMFLRSLEAIFRLSDMLDLTYKRCPEVIERTQGEVSQSVETLWRATQIIRGWKFDTKKIVLQVIRKHSEADELALRAIVDAFNRDLTPSHRRYLENCVLISYDGKHISVSLPTGFELDRVGLKFDITGGLIDLYNEISKNYLRELNKTAKFVDLNQVGIIFEKEKPPLSGIFIDIKCKRSDRYCLLPIKLRSHVNDPSSLPKGFATALTDVIEYKEVPISKTLEIDDIGHLVVLGDAGSGKSTVAQYICLLLSKQHGKGLTRIPFKIPVRMFISEKNKRKGDYSLIDYILDDINLMRRHRERKCPKSFVEYCLENGSLVILDGLDEVPDVAQRKNICTEILKLMTDFENVRFVVTSRAQGYSDAPLSWAAFLHVELKPVEKESVDDFVTRWYEYRESDPRQREERITSFQRAKNDKSVNQLTANPLMLTIMALINEKGSLPRLRTKLYDTCINTYLEREGLKDLLWYDVNEIRSVHEDLGYWMHTKFESEKQQEVDIETLKQKMLGFLVGRSPLPREIQQEKVMKFISLARNRIGLITEKERGCFSFGLRSIQEFFAACYINDFIAYGVNDLWASTRAKVSSPYWHEVIRFLIGIISQTAREQFLTKIIKEGSKESLSLAAKIVIEKNPISDNLRFGICTECIDAAMEASSENEFRTFTESLVDLMETELRDLILLEIERKSGRNLRVGLEYSVFLKKHKWDLDQENVDLALTSIIKSWKGRKLRRICTMILRWLVKETDALKENGLLDLLDTISKTQEGHVIILEEAKKLNNDQKYHVLLPIGNAQSLQDLVVLLRKALKIPLN
jgi:hypothetical protein